MRKGEKLILHLQRLFPILDGYERAQRDSRICGIIYNMTDEEFDKILGSL